MPTRSVFILVRIGQQSHPTRPTKSIVTGPPEPDRTTIAKQSKTPIRPNTWRVLAIASPTYMTAKLAPNVPSKAGCEKLPKQRIRPPS